MDLPDDVETLIAYSDPELFDLNRPQASKSRHMHFATAVRPKPQGTSSAVSNTPRRSHYRWVQQDLDEYGRPEPYRRVPNEVCPVSQRPMKLKYHSQYIIEFKDEWSTGDPLRRFDCCFGLNPLAAVFIHRPRSAAGTSIPSAQVSLEDVLWVFKHLSLDLTALAPLILGRESPALRSFVYMAVASMVYSHDSMEGAKITARILERPFSPPWGAKITLPMDNVSRGWRRRVFLSRRIAFSLAVSPSPPWPTSRLDRIS